MHFSAISTGYRFFELFNDLNDSLGTIQYKTWQPNQAQATTANGIVYTIAPTGFWRTTVTVYKENIPIAEIKPVLGKGLKVTFASSAIPFSIKNRTLFSTDLVVVDESYQKLAMIISRFKWRKFRNDYEIEILPNMLDTETNVILPLILVYCARLIQMRRAAAT